MNKIKNATRILSSRIRIPNHALENVIGGEYRFLSGAESFILGSQNHISGLSHPTKKKSLLKSLPCFLTSKPLAYEDVSAVSAKADVADVFPARSQPFATTFNSAIKAIIISSFDPWG